MGTSKRRKYTWRGSALLSVLLQFAVLTSEVYEWRTTIERRFLLAAIVAAYFALNYRYLWQQTVAASDFSTRAYRAAREHGMKSLATTYRQFPSHAAPFCVVAISLVIFGGCVWLIAREFYLNQSVLTEGVTEMVFPTKAVLQAVIGTTLMVSGAVLLWAAVASYRAAGPAHAAGKLPIRFMSGATKTVMFKGQDNEQMALVLAEAHVVNRSEKNVSLSFILLVYAPDGTVLHGVHGDWKDTLPSAGSQIVNINRESTAVGTIVFLIPKQLWDDRYSWESDIDVHRDLRLRIEDNVTNAFVLSAVTAYPPEVNAPRRQPEPLQETKEQDSLPTPSQPNASEVAKQEAKGSTTQVEMDAAQSTLGDRDTRETVYAQCLEWAKKVAAMRKQIEREELSDESTWEKFKSEFAEFINTNLTAEQIALIDSTAGISYPVFTPKWLAGKDKWVTQAWSALSRWEVRMHEIIKNTAHSQ